MSTISAKGTNVSVLGNSLPSAWTPLTLTLITGGIRLTWTPKDGTETEIWCAINGGTLYYVATVGLGVGTYDYLCDGGADFSFSVRTKLDQTVLNAPVVSSILITGGIRITITDTNGGTTSHEVYINTGSGFNLIATLPIGTLTYDYMNVGVSVTCKIRANEGTLPVHSDYSNTTDSLTVPIVDADGNTYTAITIGTQRWLVENLQTTKYNDGSSINNPIDANWAADTVGAFGWINGDIANKPVWGALYNRPATLNAKGIAPVGTRIPNNADWDTLIAYLGTATAAGGHLKITGTTYWAQAHADNSSGFTGVGSGYRNETTGNSVANKKYYGMFGTTEGKIYYLNPYDVTTASADWTQYPKRGISIRCIIN